jgi:hypothetical protein
MDINLTELERQIKLLVNFIESGRMAEEIEEHGPWYAVGYLKGGIMMLAGELEKVKARELVAR